jgi:hypothetical protein
MVNTPLIQCMPIEWVIMTMVKTMVMTGNIVQVIEGKWEGWWGWGLGGVYRCAE